MTTKDREMDKNQQEMAKVNIFSFTDVNIF